MFSYLPHLNLIDISWLCFFFFQAAAQWQWLTSLARALTSPVKADGADLMAADEISAAPTSAAAARSAVAMGGVPHMWGSAAAPIEVELLFTQD